MPNTAEPGPASSAPTAEIPPTVPSTVVIATAALDPAAPGPLTSDQHGRYADTSADSNAITVKEVGWSVPPAGLRQAAPPTTPRDPSPRPTPNDASPWLTGSPQSPEGQSGSSGGGASHVGQVLATLAAAATLMLVIWRRRPLRDLPFQFFLVAPPVSPG
jgi:hypothetical protein